MMTQEEKESIARKNQLRMKIVNQNYLYCFIAHLVLALLFFVLASIFSSRIIGDTGTFYAGQTAGAVQVGFALASMAIAVCIFLKIRKVNYVAIGVYLLLFLLSLVNIGKDAIPNLLMSVVGIGSNIFLLTQNDELEALKKEKGYPLFTGLEADSEYVPPLYVKERQTSGRMENLYGESDAEETKSDAMAVPSSPFAVQTENLAEVAVQAGSHADIFGTADMREDVSAFAEAAAAGRKEDFSELAEPSPDLALADMTEEPSSFHYTPHAEQLPSPEEVMLRLRNMKDIQAEQ